MTEFEIRDSIKQVIAKVSDIALKDIGDSASFKEDLGLDSLVLLEISVDIGLRFQLDIPEEDFNDGALLEGVRFLNPFAASFDLAWLQTRG